MNANSNQLGFNTLTADYPMVVIPSGTAANTTTLVVTGQTNASVVLDVLFRNLDTNNAYLFDVIICPTGDQAVTGYNIVQISIPPNAGNNGSISVASMMTQAPLIFDLDMAGNRVLTLESNMSIYVVNKAALTSAVYVMTKRRNF